MRGRSFSPREVFAIALAVGVAGALAPQAVDAAGKVIRLAGKTGRVVAVDKRGSLSVAVKNRPAVRVPGGVAVTNQPSVKVPDGVAVTNQPSVKVPDGVAVTNQPEVKVPGGVDVRAQPGALSAETRASMRDVFNVRGSRLGVGWVSLLPVAGDKRAAITEITIDAVGPDGVQRYRIEVWLRKGVSGECEAVSLGEFDRHILRNVSVPNGQTLQLTFPEAPLPLPPATPAGGLACFGVLALAGPNGSDTFAGATGFTY